MAQLSEQLIEEVRHRADIAEVIGQYLPLTKKGRNFTAVCPFHDDHDPSLSISIEKQIYKCFVCNAGGNVFTFVQEHEHVSFVESVRRVAELCHMDVEIASSSKEQVVDVHTQVLHKILNETIAFCEYQLQTKDGALALDYIKNREIDDSIRATFQIGYLPFGGRKLYQFLNAKGYQDEDLIAGGVCKLMSNGMVDIFEGRVLFPIHDEHGNPIAFSGRILPNDQSESRPKYMNSIQSELYTKSSVLYNAHRAKTSSRQNKETFVVEGPLDVIALHKIQVYNAVATMGTAFTREQVLLLKKLSPLQVVCYDGDQAGQNASYKAGLLLKEQRVPFRIVRNSLQLDPDEIIKQYGKEELKVMLETPLSWIEFLFPYYGQKYNLTNYSENKEFAMQMVKEMMSESDAFDAQIYKERLSLLTGFTSFQLDQLKPTSIVNKIKTVGQTIGVTKRSNIERAELEILSQMLYFKEATDLFESKLGFLIHERMKHLALFLVSFYRTNDSLDLSKLIGELHDQEELRDLVFEIEESEWLAKAMNKEALTDAFQRIILHDYDVKIEELKLEASRIQNPKLKSEMLFAVIQLKNKRKGVM